MSDIVVQRADLLKTLEDLSPGLANRELSEQTNCFVFVKDKVFTYNDEICCRAPNPIPMEIQGAIPAAKLLAVLRKMPDDELTVVVAPGQFQLKGRGRTITVRMHDEVVLSSSAVEKPTKWSRLPEDFQEAVSLVETCAGTDQNKMARTCIHMTSDFIEAYDGFQIARFNMKLKLPNPLLVRRESLKTIVRLGVTGYSVSDNWLHFTDKQLVISMRIYNESFGDLSKYLKMSGESVVLPKGLVEALEKATIFSAESPEDNKVLVDLQSNRVTVKGEGASGWYTESRRLKYSGGPVTFFMSPQLLTRLVEKHSECQVTAQSLKASLGAFCYVVSLEKVAQ